MTDWLTQYSQSLSARDSREQAHKPIIDAYTRLADRAQQALNPNPNPSGPNPNPSLNAELATTQQARAALQSTVTALRAELGSVQTALTTAQETITGQKNARRMMERKLRDREEELAGKKGMVEGVQDEMVALNLQLNLAEERCVGLQRENEELVRRWMERKGEEAERVNRDSRWA